jgi:hypothetical protein
MVSFTHIQSIGSFDDIEDMFMTRYVDHIAYHTLLTQFTQIHFQKGERIMDFNLQFFKTLNQIRWEIPKRSYHIHMLQEFHALKCELCNKRFTNKYIK